jgi:hypothetical protein
METSGIGFDDAEVRAEYTIYGVLIQRAGGGGPARVSPFGDARGLLSAARRSI